MEVGTLTLARARYQQLDLRAQIFLKEAKERSYFCDSVTHLSFFQMLMKNKIHRSSTPE